MEDSPPVDPLMSIPLHEVVDIGGIDGESPQVDIAKSCTTTNNSRGATDDSWLLITSDIEKEVTSITSATDDEEKKTDATTEEEKITTDEEKTTKSATEEKNAAASTTTSAATSAADYDQVKAVSSVPQDDDHSSASDFDWMSQEEKDVDDEVLCFTEQQPPTPPRVAGSFSQKEQRASPAAAVAATTAQYATPPRKLHDASSNHEKGVSKRDDVIILDSHNDGSPSLRVVTSKKPTSNNHKKPTFVGLRVYAKYKTTDDHYWGLIVREFRKMQSGNATYTVWFDDGDVGENVAGVDLFTPEEYNSKYRDTNGAVPSRPPHLTNYKLDEEGQIVFKYKLLTGASGESLSGDDDDDDSFPGWTPQRLFTRRCGKCSFCTRPSCGKCASCRHTNGNGSSSSEQAAAPHVCFRKMCLRISVDKKAQPAKGFPKGWSFFFQSLDTNHSPVSTLADELYIQNPSGAKFRSVAAACARHKLQLAGLGNLKHDFHRHIGENSPGPSASSNDKTGKRKQSPESTKRKRKKGERMLSSTKEIGSHVYSRFEKESYYWGEIVGKTWKEGKTGKSRYHYDIAYEDGDYQSDLSDDTEGKLNDLNIYTEFQFSTLTKVLPPPRPKDLQPPKRKNTAYTPAEIYQLRCSKCNFCVKDPCNRCFSCKNNASKTTQKMECCLQKMCAAIEKDMKKQPAPGLPDGWTFFSGQEPTLSIASPDNDVFDSIEDALDRCQDEVYDKGESIFEFQKHIGGSVFISDDKHELVGKQYCLEWTDVDCHIGIIYGEITECERDELDPGHLTFTVKYHEHALEDVNQKKKFCALKAPRTQSLGHSWALGGHNAFKEKIMLPQEPILDKGGEQGFRWRIPDMRVEQLGSNQLPKLTLTWNGFRLVFDVKKSSIHGSGFGVFVQCTSLIPGRPVLRLNRLELLDLGVYAPLRDEDMKETCVFLMKNFIYCLAPEEWAFDTSTKGFEYDITDDFTGELHSIAARKILPYVNECKQEDKPTVNAEHDPQGVVHYLLGNKSENLVLPTDDSPTEIFINYGSEYEKVRIRKKYSFLPPGKQKQLIKKMSKDACEYFEEIDTFEERDVASCVRFMSKAFTKGRKPSAKHVRRAFAIAVLIRRRALILLRDASESPSASELSESLALCQKVVTFLLSMADDAKLTQLNESGNVDGLITEAVRPFLTNLSELECY